MSEYVPLLSIFSGYLHLGWWCHSWAGIVSVWWRGSSPIPLSLPEQTVVEERNMIPGWLLFDTSVYALQKSDVWEIFRPTLFSVSLYPRSFNIVMIYIYWKLCYITVQHLPRGSGRYLLCKKPGLDWPSSGQQQTARPAEERWMDPTNKGEHNMTSETNLTERLWGRATFPSPLCWGKTLPCPA